MIFFLNSNYPSLQGTTVIGGRTNTTSNSPSLENLSAASSSSALSKSPSPNGKAEKPVPPVRANSVVHSGKSLKPALPPRTTSRISEENYGSLPTSNNYAAPPNKRPLMDAEAKGQSVSSCQIPSQLSNKSSSSSGTISPSSTTSSSSTSHNGFESSTADLNGHFDQATAPNISNVNVGSSSRTLIYDKPGFKRDSKNMALLDRFNYNEKSFK